MESPSKKRKESDDFSKLLEGAGLQQDQFFNKHLVSHLEVALDEISSMESVSNFVNLKSLVITFCGIQNIEGLEPLNQLEELWLCDNQITRIEGLDYNLCLRKLYLQSNQISVIEGLEHLKSLQVLWIAENNLTSLRGIEEIQSLQELNAACNQIKTCANQLQNLQELEILNISSNQIGSFKEILPLSQITSLKSLSLNDPHYGENPICNLCNYQIFAMYHLPRLQVLDCATISQEAKSNAQNTFIKKKMYYNMRIKTIKRCASNIINNVIQSILMQYEANIQAEIKPLIFEEESIIREQDELEILDNPEIPNFYNFDGSPTNPLHEEILDELKSQLRTKRKLLRLRIDKEEEKIREAIAIANQITEKVKQEADKNIVKLIAELETGGNIRFEEGNPEEKWFQSIAELLQQRKSPQMPQIIVTRVIRIHNKFIRSRFDERLEQLVDLGDNQYRQNIQYLFFTDSPSKMERFIDTGSANLPIPLITSLMVSERGRVNLKGNLDNLIFEKPGMMVVCKVYLTQNQVQDQIDPTYPDNQSLKEILLHSPPENPEDQLFLFRLNEADQKHRIWFAYDNQLVMPEYLVYFEYESSLLPMSGIPEEPANLDELYRADLAQMQLSLYAFKSYCSKFLNLKNCQELSLQPTISQRNQIESLSSIILQQISQTFDLTQVHAINVHNNKLKSLLPFSQLPQLRNLTASFNLIESLDDLGCPNLLYLDLTYNPVRSLSGTENIPKIESMVFANCQISLLDEINKLEVCQQITLLNLQGNPVCFNSRYKYTVLQSCQNIQDLDGEQVQKSEIQACINYPYNITLDLVLQHWDPPNNYKNNQNWAKFVRNLTLEGMHIKSMYGISSFTNLRRLNLASNDIRTIQDLADCVYLEELVLEDNLINTTTGLNYLKQLKKLDISKNRIQSIEDLDRLENLSQLSIDDNQISSLQGLEQLDNLMELYIGNNAIEQMKEIIHLKKLQQLIILDLSGNQTTQEKQYRNYVIFHLKKLKVLDGVSVMPQEHNQAKDAFGGRLTEEILDARVGQVDTNYIKILDLSELKLRSFKHMFHYDKFKDLQELNLSGNQFTSINCLGKLPYLNKLIMSRNRIETLKSSPDSGLSNLLKLVSLDLSHNLIQNMQGLQQGNLPQLRVLVLTHNNLISLEGLQFIQSLRELDISFNKLKSFEGGLPLSLRFIRADNNMLRSLNGLYNLRQLKVLQCQSNRLQENELDKIADLHSLIELTLSSNPLARVRMYRLNVLKRIPQLKYLDNTPISPEEQQQIEIITEPKAPPLVHLAQQQGPKVAVKLTSVNFDGIFKEPPRRPSSSQALGGVLGVTPLSHPNQRRRK